MRRLFLSTAVLEDGEDRSTTSLFNPTEEHLALRQLVRSFAEKEVDPQRADSNAREAFNRPLFARCGDLGLLAHMVDAHGAALGSSLLPHAGATGNLALIEYVAVRYGEVCDGLRSYFNQALPTLLLYKYERRQYADRKKEEDKKAPVDLYGAEHLLRLFVKLPVLLARCSLQREHMTVLNAKLNELIKFMQANKAKYFVADYIVPDEDYLQWWQGNE